MRNGAGRKAHGTGKNTLRLVTLYPAKAFGDGGYALFLSCYTLSLEP
jgi:hypothetical protein